MLPSPPEEIGTTFLFYQRKNPDLAQSIAYKPGNLEVTKFNGSLPTKIIIHGFGSSCNRVWAHEMRQALLTTLDCNVICVAWDKGAATPNYMRAAVNTRLVGRQVALLIKQLVNRYDASLDDMHLVGFSLGAHVAGFAGQELDGKISRITGLDPAGPLFEGYSPSARLDKSDARFVDVIHSNGDSLLRGGLGTADQLGHVDFYPNGGRMQKGCTNLFLGAFSDLIWSGPGDGRSLCNHRRSYRFFIDSISPICTFPATPCDSYESLLAGECFPCGASNPCGQMGYYADRSSARGKLYLITREDEPFCANQHRLTITGQGGPDSETYGKMEITLISSNGVNETFPITSEGDEIKLPLVRMLVAHPAIRHIKKVQLRYTAYNGWLYSGTDSWTIDKVAIVNSFGSSMSYCQRNMVLPSGKPVVLNLRPGNCRVSSFRPNQSFWKWPRDVPAASVAETIPEPPQLEEIKSNHVRSFTAEGPGPGPQRVFGAHHRPRRPPPDRAGELRRDPPPDERGDELRQDEPGRAADEPGRATDEPAELPAPPPTAEALRTDAKPVRGPDDLGVIVIQGVREEEPAGGDRGGDGGGGGGGGGGGERGRRPTLAQLARVTNSSESSARRGKAVTHVPVRARGNGTVHPGPRGTRGRPRRPPPTAEPVYYVQYLPPELFDRPSADYIPSAAVVPPPPVRPPPGGRAARNRGHRFGFLRHLFPSWESPETRYIPLHEGRARDGFRSG